jgi:hypothetical protein
MTGPLCGTAAILIVLSQMLRLGVGLIFGRESASTTTHAITYTFALLGMGALLLALTALYAREAPTLGPLGRAGYLTAFLGTLLVAGDWWFEAFVVPTIATQAPQILAGGTRRDTARRRRRDHHRLHRGLDPVRHRALPLRHRRPIRRDPADRRGTRRRTCPVHALADPAGGRRRLDRRIASSSITAERRGERA